MAKNGSWSDLREFANELANQPSAPRVWRAGVRGPHVPLQRGLGVSRGGPM